MRPIRLIHVAALVAALAACGPNTGGGTASLISPIEGGSVETGWPGVGALTIYSPGYGGYAGAFCTATLVAPQWVLTAAHCVTPTSELPVSPEITRFFIGSDARPGSGGTPSGTLVQAHKFFPRSDYSGTDNDIALVQLSEPVSGVTPYPISTTAMSNSLDGQGVFYVGFGASEGVKQTGSGLKRSATIPIYAVYDASYQSDSGSSGPWVCFGDSGGPGFMQIGGTWKVVGVNDSVGGQGSDACQGPSNQARVDAYASWISGLIGTPIASCKSDATMCNCAAACTASGTCDNTLCQTKTCEDAYNCIAACDPSNQGCQVDCYNAATAQGQSQMDAMFACFQDMCGTITDDTQFQQCVQSKCGSQVNTCLGITTGSATCKQMTWCLDACSATDQACAKACYNTGTAQAQQLYEAEATCIQDKCGTLTGTAEQDCAVKNCLTQIEACSPPTNCKMSGGGCPSGQACYPALGGKTDCYPSDGKGLGASCDPGAVNLPCADGYLCMSVGTGVPATCSKLCEGDPICGAEGQCDAPIFQGYSTVGVCGCRDQDKDGYCSKDDCDDSDPAVHPGATEKCGNAKDDNCNGQTDEGCSTCTDADKDGYCADKDCNDNDPSIHPGATEVCGDGIDQDCDGRDLPCPCDGIDADGDGYCEDTDCDDQAPNVFPGAVEVCGNGIDDNCDGQTDEGCETTPPPAKKPAPKSKSCAAGPDGAAVPWVLLPLIGLVVRRTPTRGRRSA